MLEHVCLWRGVVGKQAFRKIAVDQCLTELGLAAKSHIDAAEQRHHLHRRLAELSIEQSR